MIKAIHVLFALLSLALAHVVHYHRINPNDSLALDDPDPPTFMRPTPRLRRRKLEPPATNDAWFAFICRGNRLLDLMKANDRDAGQLLTPPQDSAASQFTTDFPALFTKWYYHLEDSILTDLGFNMWGMQAFLKGIEVSMAEEQWKFWECEHFDADLDAPDINDQTYTVDGQKYRATGARFMIPIHKDGGVMLFLSRFGPEYEATNNRIPPIPKEGLPAIYRSSDITWGLWKIQAGDAPLKHIVSYGITNKATQSAIARVLENAEVKEEDLPEWPGLLFFPDSEDFKALLGTPNGRGVAYLLAQRKNELGLKTIKSIRLFLPETIAWRTQEPLSALYFEIAPVETRPGQDAGPP